MNKEQIDALPMDKRVAYYEYMSTLGNPFTSPTTSTSSATSSPMMQQSAGDVSYIKEQPGRFSLWRDNTNSTPVITPAQATTQGFIPLPAPPPQPALPAPPHQQALRMIFCPFSRSESFLKF